MANSVSDLLKKVNATRKKILDSTDLDEKAAQFLRSPAPKWGNQVAKFVQPKTGTLATTGRNALSRPVTVSDRSRRMLRAINDPATFNPYAPKNFARGERIAQSVANNPSNPQWAKALGGAEESLIGTFGNRGVGDVQRGVGNIAQGAYRDNQQQFRQGMGQLGRGSINTALGVSALAAPGSTLASGVLGGGLNAGIAKLTGQDVAASAGRGFGEGVRTAGLIRFTNPATDKLIKARSGLKFLPRQVATRGIGAGMNIAEDFFLDKTAGRDYTEQDAALSGLLGAALSGNADALRGAESQIRKLFPKKQADQIITQITKMKKDGTKYTQTVGKGGFGKAQQLRDNIVGMITDPNEPSRNIPVRQSDIDAGKLTKEQLDSMWGGLAGMEMYQDENGEWKMRFNPQKAAAGMLVAGGLKAVKGNLPTKGVEPGNIPLKPKTDLLNQAEQLRKQGYEALVENQIAAQEAANLRSMFGDEFFEQVNRLKRYARSKKVQAGDTETLRARDSETFDKVTMAVREAFGDDSMSDDAAIQQALNIPTKQDTKVSRPIEFVQAKELEQKAKQVRDLVYNAQASPETKAKVLAQNQKAIEKAAIDEFERENREFFEQVGATRTKRQQANALMRDALKMIGQTTPSYVDESVKDISGLNAGLSTLTRNLQKAFGNNYEAVKRDVIDPFDNSKGQMYRNLDTWSDKLRYVTDELGIKMKSKESAAVQEFGEGKKTLDQLNQEFGAEKAQKITEAASWFRQQYDQVLDEVNQVRAAIYGENSDKLIPKRKDYFRHFHDLSSTFGGLKNIFENSAAITPSLAGTSQVTRPKSKWLSFAQRRLGDKTDLDAVGGFIDYLTAAEYAKNVDPHIQKFRDLRQGLVDYAEANPSTTPNGLNNLIEYLDDFANDLAGKTNPYDRPLQKIVGRKTMSVLNWANSRIKANVIVGNLSSSVAQFFNIPQGIAEAGVGNYMKGATRAVTSILDDNAVSNQSNFLKERYSSTLYDQFNESLLAKPKQFAAWITGIGDEVGTRSIWNALYEKAIKEGVSDPVNYADNLTRDLVAGRGIGEVPLLQKSKTLQLLAPFQLEVANSWYVMKKWAGEKEAKKLITFFVASYLMNQGAKMVRGSDVVFDPIQAGMDALNTYNEEENKQTGALMAGGRVAGEVLSNIPFVQSIAGLYPEYGMPIGGVGEDGKRENITREELFGEGDPTRFGSGLLLGKGMTDPLFKIAPSWGGAQLKKTLEGAKTLSKGYSESKGGKIRFTTNSNPINAVQTLAFGQYSTPTARQYFDTGSPSLSDKQSAKYKEILSLQGKKAADEYYQKVQDDKQSRGVASMNDRKGLIQFGNKQAKADTTAQPASEFSLPTSESELVTLYKDATSTLNGIEEKRTKAKYGQYDSELKREEALAKLDQEEAFAQQMLSEIESKNPQAVFNYGLETYKSGSGATVEQRAEWVAKTLENVSEDKLQDTINKMWEAKVITTGSNGVATYLKENFGIDLKYTGTDKKIKSSSGGKKIKLGAPKKLNLVSTVKAPPKVNFRGSSKINTANLLKLQAPPKTAKSVTPKLKILKQPNLTV